MFPAEEEGSGDREVREPIVEYADDAEHDSNSKALDSEGSSDTSTEVMSHPSGNWVCPFIFSSFSDLFRLLNFISSPPGS